MADLSGRPRGKSGRLMPVDRPNYKRPEYRVWNAMIQRCTNPKSERWGLYGGRGIGVCARWRDFGNFLADMGQRPSPKHSIDRIDNNRGYEPGNCRWVTQPEQMKNMRRNHPVTGPDGRTMILCDWAKEIGISESALRKRLRNWPVNLALSVPVYCGNRIAIRSRSTASPAPGKEGGR